MRATRWIIWLLGVGAVLRAPAPARAGVTTNAPHLGVVLGWEMDPDPRTAGYRLYEAGAATNVFDAGNVTSYGVSNLTWSSTYYLTLTCYTTNGLESAKSVQCTVVTPPPRTNHVVGWWAESSPSPAGPWQDYYLLGRAYRTNGTGVVYLRWQITNYSQ